MQSALLSIADLQISRQPARTGGGVAAPPPLDDSAYVKLPPRPFPSLLIADDAIPTAETTPAPPSSRYFAHPEVSQLATKSILSSASEDVRISRLSDSYQQQQHQNQQQHQQRQAESLLKAELEFSKVVALEGAQAQILQLEAELASQRQHYDTLLDSQARSFQTILQEKDSCHQEVCARNEAEIARWKKLLHENEQSYIQQLSEQEKAFELRFQELQRQSRAQLEAVQAQQAHSQQLRELAEQARLEAKEDQVKQNYEKKLKKMEKLIQLTIEKYRQKELMVDGALQECRSECKALKETIELKEKHYKEHLHFQDVRLLEAQNKLDSVNVLEKVAETWRSTANELASYVVRTCATVGELPYDFLAMQKDGSSVASEVFDEVTAKEYNPQDKYVRFQRAQHVAVSKSRLTRALRLSKVIHERVKAEIHQPL